MRKLIPIILYIVYSVAFQACGYHISHRGSYLPVEFKTIAIPVFQNETMEPVIEETLTMGVIKGFREDARINVVNQDMADLILLGKVISFQEIPLSFDSDQNVLEYRIEATAHFDLVKGTDTKDILWKGDITVRTEYPVTEDVMFTRAAKLQAFKELARNLADQVVDRIMEGI